MRKNFVFSSLKLILLGVALGMIARYLVGVPTSAEHQRRFTSPIDRRFANPETSEGNFDFELNDDWANDSE